MLLLLAATIGMNSCQLSSVDSDVHISQPPPEIIPCASECSDESLPQLEFKSSREQLCEETDQIRVPIDNLGAKQQPLRSELLMQENTLPIAKTTVRDQGSQTTTKECVQNLDRTLSNPPQSVISSGQTHHQPTLPSGHGEAGSPYPEGVSQARNTVTESQEMIPPPNSSESQTTSISQHSDVGAKATLECMSTTQPLHRQTEHQSSANYNITCILQFLQQLSQASQTGQLQNNSPGKFYPQDTNEQRQTENKEHQSLSQCEDSQVCPLQMHSSLVQPHSGSQALQRASQVQLSRPHPVQQTQAQPSQMWSPPVEPSQSSTVYTAQPLTAQMLPSEVQSRPVQPPQVQPSQTLPSPLELVPQPPQMKLTHQVTPPPVQRSLSPPASAPQNKPPRDQVESPPTLPSQPLHESKPYQNQEQASLMEPSGNQVQLPPLTQVPIQPSPVQPLQLRRPPSQIQPSQPPIPIHTAQVELFAGSSKSSLARCNKDSQLLHNNEPQAMCITSQGNILSHILPTSASMTSGSAEVHLVPTLQHPSTPGYAKHQSQTQTAASGLHSDHQGGTQHSLSVNCGLSPQVPARQSEPLGNGPFYPQRSGEQQGRQNLAQKSSSSPQLPQPQGHAGQPYSQPSQIQPQQTATVQGPQQHIINNVSGLPDAQIFDSQPTQLPQSYDSPALMVKTYVPVSPTNAQIPLQGNQMQTGATHCSNPPIIDRQQSGVLVQPSTGNVHTQTPDWVSTVQIPDAGLHDQRVVQTTSKPQEGQLSEQVANHTQLSNYGLPPPYTKHQSSPPSTSVQGASQLSYHHGATQAPCIPTTTSDSFGQTPMQHSTISPSGRRSAGGLYSNSLPTLHERIEEMPIRLQRQRTTDSHHGQHPLPQHGEQQINFGNRYTQQETLDTKPRNIYTSEPQVHCNINPTNGSQQTNVLDKAQAIPMDNNLRGKEKPSYQHVHSRIGQHNPASDISQQLRQGHPESLRAVMASSGASSHPPQTRQEYVNMHGAGGNNGSGRQIPLPQTRTSYKGSGQDRVHTAPVGHHSMHSTQPHTPLSRQPQSVYNQSNVQAGIPSKSIGASVFTDTANGNVPHGYYGAMDNQRKASTAPQYLHSTTEDENNVSYHGSLSGSTNASRGATFQHYQHQNQGQPMNVQPEKQYQTTAIRTQQSHVQVNPPTAGSNTCPPLAQTVSHWVSHFYDTVVGCYMHHLFLDFHLYSKEDMVNNPLFLRKNQASVPLVTIPHHSQALRYKNVHELLYKFLQFLVHLVLFK